VSKNKNMKMELLTETERTEVWAWGGTPAGWLLTAAVLVLVYILSRVVLAYFAIIETMEAIHGMSYT
jgi:hypothetical protein